MEGSCFVFGIVRKDSLAIAKVQNQSCTVWRKKIFNVKWYEIISYIGGFRKVDTQESHVYKNVARNDLMLQHLVQNMRLVVFFPCL